MEERTNDATISWIKLCTIAPSTLIITKLIFFRFIRVAFDMVEIKLAGKEYIIIIGLPIISGTIMDFNKEIINDSFHEKTIIIKIKIKLESPILINGRNGIIGGIKFSITPRIRAKVRKIAVILNFLILIFLLFICDFDQLILPV